MLDAIPEMSLSSSWQGEQSLAPREGIWDFSKGSKEAPLSQGVDLHPGEQGLVVTEPFPCTAQTTAQICPGFQTKDSDPFSRQIGPFIMFAVNENSLAEGKASLSGSIRGLFPPCPYCDYFYSHLNANLFPACE